MTFDPGCRAGCARWFLLAVWPIIACGWPAWALAQAPAALTSDAVWASEAALAQTALDAPTNDSATTGPGSVTASVTASTATANTSTAAPPRFDVEVEADAALRDFLLRHLELMRYRNLPDLDAAELERLLARAQDNLLDLLGTLGYFGPQVRIDGPLPVGPAPLGTVRISVQAGAVTRIASADVYFRGDIAENPQTADQRAAVRQAFGLRPGSAFSQADWGRAKSAALRALTTRRYPAGRIYNSLADVDSSDQSVRLSLELDSGTPLRFGEVRVQGAQRFDTAVVERLVRLSGVTPGSDYDLAKLQDAQQRIADTGYFDSAHVSVDPGVDQTSAPVIVQLREGQRQKLVLGVGGSTDSGARLSAEHTHLRVPGIDWRAVNKLQLERDDRQISTEWTAPVDDKGWQWITSALIARQVDGNDTTTSQRLRLGQAQRSDALDRSFFMQYDRARSVNSLLRSLGTGAAEASISANYAWTRRRFDSMPFPQRGYGLGLELGAGYTLVGQRRPFGRTVGRWMGYWPLSGSLAQAFQAPPSGVAASVDASQNVNATSRWGRLVLRAEGGAVWTQPDTPVPETQLFLTGGDATVRGYGLRNIGVAQADGGVSPGRYMASGSAEWQIPIWRQGQRTPWEAALFVDGGSVAEKIGDLKARWGLGAGVRYNSPVGPLRLDVAYGVQPREWRLHFNVGFTF